MSGRHPKKWLAAALCLLFIASAALAVVLMCVHSQCHCMREQNCLVCERIAETFSLIKRMSLAAGIAFLAALAFRCTRMPSIALAGGRSATLVALKTRLND